MADRFAENGIGPELVRRVLQDGGDSLYEAAGSGSAGWADAYGGPLAVALLAAEVSALAAHLNSRGSAVRSAAVAELLDEFSAVTVAERLGVSRQQVYEVRRGEVKNEYISRVPWRVK
ncbi:MAG TPA: hypothetical protein VJS19_03615 [Candidatus Dormibacteraeota bacterium]|nr:hypothetical protein [Candidatus Dormibacteraeota bacterium]